MWLVGGTRIPAAEDVDLNCQVCAHTGALIECTIWPIDVPGLASMDNSLEGSVDKGLHCYRLACRICSFLAEIKSCLKGKGVMACVQIMRSHIIRV
jgi:hypothetical protein